MEQTEKLKETRCNCQCHAPEYNFDSRADKWTDCPCNLCWFAHWENLRDRLQRSAQHTAQIQRGAVEGFVTWWLDTENSSMNLPTAKEKYLKQLESKQGEEG